MKASARGADVTKKAADRPDKDQLLLDAAARVFRRNGYARATLRDIASEAGMLLGSLQYRYETKDTLFVALAERELGRSLEALEAAREAEADPLGRIRHFVFDQADEVLSEDSLVVWIVGALTLAPEESEAIARQQARFTEAFDALLAEAIAAGQLRGDVPVPLLRNYLLGPLAWTAQRVFGAVTLPASEIVDAYWRLALEGAGRS